MTWYRKAADLATRSLKLILAISTLTAKAFGQDFAQAAGVEPQGRLTGQRVG